MKELIRQTAVLSTLWALCELILPQGGSQRLVRLTAGILMLTALLGTAGRAFDQAASLETALTISMQRASSEVYQRTALMAMANQLQGYCERMARRAGYAAQAEAALCMDGSLDHVRVKLSGNGLIPPAELRLRLAQQLNTQEERIWLEGT